MRYVGFDAGGGRDYQEIANAAGHSTIATEVTEDEYNYMLNVLPPIYCEGGGFIVMEATTSCGMGDVHAMYKKIGDRYYGKWVIRGKRFTYISRVDDAYPIDPEHAKVAAEANAW